MGQKPVKSFREGGVEVAIWHTMRDGRNAYSCKMKRTYKSGEEWIDTEFLNQRDTPMGIAVLQRAYAWMAHQSERGQDAQRQPRTGPSQTYAFPENPEDTPSTNENPDNNPKPQEIPF